MEYMTNIMELIETYDGTKALRKDCRYIKGNFYQKDVQCFNIAGVWYRVNSGKIAFDNEINSWVIVNSLNPLVEGIIDIIDNIPKIGLFSLNKAKNTTLFYSGKEYIVIDEKLLLSCSLIEEGVNGKYYYKNNTSLPKEYTSKLRPNKDGYYSFPFNYGSAELIPEFTETFNDNFIGESLLSDAWKYLDKFTFGVEFETERGAIPEKYLKKNGLIACRDGSISGFEYTTIPLFGESGIQCIKSVCNLLKKYCGCTPNESLHIHIGGYPKTIKAISALYRLGIILQKDIYSLFPYYYADTSNFKRKGYCNPLYRINPELKISKEIFTEIYQYLSGNREAKFIKFPTGAHPLDRSGQHKWEISPRYYYMNLIPLIWGNRRTVEFRCHTPTIQSQKVINWLFILVAMLKYALNNSTKLVNCIESELPKVTLREIVQITYPPEISKILINYMSSRRIHYHNKNDVVGEIEIFSEETQDIFELKEFV